MRIDPWNYPTQCQTIGTARKAVKSNVFGQYSISSLWKKRDELNIDQSAMVLGTLNWWQLHIYVCEFRMLCESHVGCIVAMCQIILGCYVLLDCHDSCLSSMLIIQNSRLVGCELYTFSRLNYYGAWFAFSHSTPAPTQNVEIQRPLRRQSSSLANCEPFDHQKVETTDLKKSKQAHIAHRWVEVQLIHNFQRWNPGWLRSTIQVRGWFW